MREDRIRLRVWVLICLKRINDKRISDRAEGEAKRRKMNDGGSSSSSSRSNSVSGGEGGEVMLKRSARISNRNSNNSNQQQPQRHELNGVLAESKITAFEMWREMAMFLE